MNAPVNQSAVTTPAAQPTPDLGRRHSMYQIVHKGLRAYMCEVMVAVGRLDHSDDAEVALAVEQVNKLLEIFAAHLHKENTYVHPAMEARRPGSTATTAGDHVHHEEDFLRIARLAEELEQSPADRRDVAALRLYHELTLFVAENLRHMQVEETHNNSILWDAYTDEELLAIEHRIVAAIAPEHKMVFLRWMVPTATPQEAAGVLKGLEESAPPQAYRSATAMLRSVMSEGEWTRLVAALG